MYGGIRHETEMARFAVSVAMSSNGINANRGLITEMCVYSTDPAGFNISFDNSIGLIPADRLRFENSFGGVIIVNDDALLRTLGWGARHFISIEPVQSHIHAWGSGGGGITGGTVRVFIPSAIPQGSTILTLPAVPGNADYQVIVNQNGENMGGRFNPNTGMIEARVNSSGDYAVRENVVNFADIQHKSAEMQEAIRILASKGIISGTAPLTFSPDDPMSRAALASMLIRALDLYNPNANGRFADVTQRDWFFASAGSARANGIMHGYAEDNTFRGMNVISKAEILTTATNTMILRMNYRLPNDAESELRQFTDRTNIPGWAESHVAMAAREGLIVLGADGMLRPAESMTRGEAAVIVRRLFERIR
jgi:hypothetical protein